jgi:predicted RNA binding protein YcfA (HicA-like mRNA interferase family)
MKPAELLRRLERLATRNDWEIQIKQGGSHTKVWLRGQRTVVSRHPSDLKTGTLRGILRQLGITESDLEK